MLVAVLVGVLLLAAGCQFWKSEPLVLRMEARGRVFGASLALPPEEDEGGVRVSFYVSGGSEYTIDYGDGSEKETSRAGEFVHTYTQAGAFTVRAWCRGRSVTGRVIVENDPPVAYPGWLATACEWMNKMIVDLRYREHGCYNGAPLTVSGAYDPDGDDLVYELTVTGPDAHGDMIEYSVFAPNGERVNGQFVSGGVFVVFPGWTAAHPPYPFAAPQCPTNPTPPPTGQPVELGTVTFHYVVKDQWGGVAEATWKHDLTALGCHR